MPIHSYERLGEGQHDLSRENVCADFIPRNFLIWRRFTSKALARCFRAIRSFAASDIDESFSTGTFTLNHLINPCITPPHAPGRGHQGRCCVAGALAKASKQHCQANATMHQEEQSDADSRARAKRGAKGHVQQKTQLRKTRCFPDCSASEVKAGKGVGRHQMPSGQQDGQLGSR